MSELPKVFQAVIWTTEGKLGQREEVIALSLDEARKKLVDEYGEEATISLYSEEDARRAR